MLGLEGNFFFSICVSESICPSYRILLHECSSTFPFVAANATKQLLVFICCWQQLLHYLVSLFFRFLWGKSWLAYMRVEDVFFSSRAQKT